MEDWEHCGTLKGKSAGLLLCLPQWQTAQTISTERKMDLLTIKLKGISEIKILVSKNCPKSNNIYRILLIFCP